MTLVVTQSEFDVIEGDEGTTSVVTVMVSATLSLPQPRPILYELIISGSTTASPDEYSLTNPLVIIPANYTGTFTASIDINIVGDDMIESNETVVYDVLPLAPGDMVDFAQPDGSTAITINIIDNDGKYPNITCPRHIVKAKPPLRNGDFQGGI